MQAKKYSYKINNRNKNKNDKNIEIFDENN